MRIAMMVRGYMTTPKPKDIVYAPIDLAAYIADGLAKRGHTVHFYGPKGTKLHTRVITLGLDPIVNNIDEFHQFLSRPDLMSHYIPGSWDSYLAAEMFQRAKKRQYDLIYFVHPEVALPFSRFFPRVPIAFTLHDPIYHWYRNIFKMFKTANQYFISITNNQRRPMPNLNFAGTVYNGIDTDKFPFSAKGGKNLLFVGRITPEKGLKEAIEAAKLTNSNLDIIGPNYPDKMDYFNQYVKPHLGKQIRYLGFIEREKLSKYYRNSKALLAPIQWDEPFGMTFVEAMASGTPVIAFKRGSAPEVIINSKTGYLVKNVDEMANAIKKIDFIDRKACRDHVEENFTVDRMVDGYEAVFASIIKAHRKIKIKSFIRPRLSNLQRVLIPEKRSSR